MTHLYSSCTLCPRNCNVNRLTGETGFCGETAALRIGAAVIHRGEEPPLVGTGGSGTIFISGCNLGCAFCQNYQISQGEKERLGRTVTAEEFTKICKALRDKGAENINIVTGSHAIPTIAEGLAAAKNAGVQIPVLWNSSAYETTEALELLKDSVDIYLPDLKTLDSEIADKFFNAPDYPQTASSAILKMIETANTKEKVIIRHLILPGFLESSRTVLRWFAENAVGRAQLSLMTQYTPIPNRKRPMPNRFITEDEYEKVLGWLEEFGIEDGFCQELVTGSEWLPDFNKQNPFSSELSVPVWHFTSQT
ncbi:MAG: radical SAM protein [Treponema sp.]|nr:radical SAM protein [Treponema sp.]